MSTGTIFPSGGQSTSGWAARPVTQKEATASREKGIPAAVIPGMRAGTV
jgi:hypothetical protein